MAMKVRRIVTGHNASGKAIVKTDEQVTAVPRVDAGISGCEIWSTDQMPIDNSSAADAAQRAGFVKHNNYVGNGGGSTFRINEWAPGHARFTHRTETMDYAIVLSGEIDLELDSGKVVHLKPGDVVVQRGTMHTWVNRGLGPGGHRIHPDRRQARRGQRRGNPHRFSYPAKRGQNKKGEFSGARKAPLSKMLNELLLTISVRQSPVNKHQPINFYLV
jgi:uncharacterized cupin superfamily protein